MRILCLCLLVASAGAAAEVPHVNWENHPTRGLDLSPDGRTLAVAHTADARVQLFDVSEGQAVAIGHVRVGIDPVSVRFRSANELWVANHLSDSVSVVEVDDRSVLATLPTLDEPADIVFAGSPERAFVACSQANTILVFDPTDLAAPPVSVAIEAEDPRALAASPDGATVYVAVFESGNASTILGGGSDDDDVISFPPNVTREAATPHGGQNPPPNNGAVFSPGIRAGLPPAPKTGLIVKMDRQGRWMDDNRGDWSDYVNGSFSSRSGRVAGWSLPDRDIAIIDATTLEVAYASGLMNIGMAIAFNPGTGEITLVGTDATNHVRFEPNLNGRFLRVNLARVDADTGVAAVSDLNPHLDYAEPRIGIAQRRQSLGDPRAIVWESSGQRGYVVGMGSSNLVAIDAAGNRLGEPLAVGQGPAGLAIDEANGRLYVWNHFDATLSTVDLDRWREIERSAVFNPLPEAVVEGRRFLYDTHATSGLGHIACASCHVDGRMDRLAWDLGDPSGRMKRFNQNCVSDLGDGAPCEDFHPMKGPMMTQTLQDIIGHEPLHWRGDRDGIEEFNPAFVGLLGGDGELSAEEMNRFKGFLATLTFPPNPFRNVDNSLPSSLALDGHFTTGRFTTAGQPLGTGNARRGLDLYTDGLLDNPFHCASCHTLPTGMAVNGPLFAFGVGSVGGSVMDPGPHGENHLGVVSIDGSTNRSIKVPQLRNLYEKVGFDLTQRENRAGFGFLHDGSVDSLARFVSLEAFEQVGSRQDVADLVALLLSFSGSDFGDADPNLGGAAPQSRDTHAAVGRTWAVNGSIDEPGLQTALREARNGRIDFVARSRTAAWVFRGAQNAFDAGDGSTPLSPSRLANQGEVILMAVPAGLGERLGIDRDGDGLADAAELDQGSNPADPASTALRPTTGLWFNPARSGHGLDVELLGDFMFVTWYTYHDDGTPIWYQASAPFGEHWSADLFRFELDEAGDVSGTVVGGMEMDFSSASTAEWRWRIGERSGAEPMQVLPISDARTLRNYTGTWYDPEDPGWGMTISVEGNFRVGVLYYYDAQRQPRWALGQSDNAAANTMEMLSFTGFCPDCERVEPVFTAAGEATFRFAAPRAATFEIAVIYPDLPGGAWERSTEGFIPLSDAPVDYSVF